MKHIFRILFIMVSFFLFSYATPPLSDELVVLHNVTTAEMNAISSPIEGSLIYNLDEEIYERNTTQWHRIASDGSETKIIAGNCAKVTGIGTTTNPYYISRDLPGKTKTTAGQTCKTLLATGCAQKDGTYWINPDGGSTSNAFEVYCDMSTDGGGWIRLDYTADLIHTNHFGNVSDRKRYLPTNFSLVLTDTQINNIRAVSTEGKQRYHGTCQGVIHHLYRTTNYAYAFGFRFHTGDETVNSQRTYPNTNITVSYDGCKANSGSRSTDFDIVDIRVPIVNVHSRDNGARSEKFGSPLTKNPAWLR